MALFLQETWGKKPVLMWTGCKHCSWAGDPAAGRWLWHELGTSRSRRENGAQRCWEMQRWQGSSRPVAAFCMGPGLLAIPAADRLCSSWQGQLVALFHAINLSPLLERPRHKLVTSSAEVTSILLAFNSGECWFLCPITHLWTHRLEHGAESWRQVL